MCATKTEYSVGGGGDNLCLCGAYSPVGKMANKQVNKQNSTLSTVRKLTSENCEG